MSSTRETGLAAGSQHQVTLWQVQEGRLSDPTEGSPCRLSHSNSNKAAFICIGLSCVQSIVMYITFAPFPTSLGRDRADIILILKIRKLRGLGQGPSS